VRRNQEVADKDLNNQRKKIYFSYLYSPTAGLCFVVQVRACGRVVPYQIPSITGQYPKLNTKHSVHNLPRNANDHSFEIWQWQRQEKTGILGNIFK
jgi:hypothetical protein